MDVTEFPFPLSADWTALVGPSPSGMSAHLVPTSPALAAGLGAGLAPNGAAATLMVTRRGTQSPPLGAANSSAATAFLSWLWHSPALLDAAALAHAAFPLDALDALGTHALVVMLEWMVTAGRLASTDVLAVLAPTADLSRFYARLGFQRASSAGVSTMTATVSAILAHCTEHAEGRTTATPSVLAAAAAAAVRAARAESAAASSAPRRPTELELLGGPHRPSIETRRAALSPRRTRRAVASVASTRSFNLSAPMPAPRGPAAGPKQPPAPAPAKPPAAKPKSAASPPPPAAAPASHKRATPPAPPASSPPASKRVGGTVVVQPSAHPAAKPKHAAR